ncbi:MAG: type I glutamate--ammonia ligase [bacterium]|nr:type I glutamate--ammonia ligase [bacterium]
MSKYTRDDILRMVKEEDVEFIRLQFTDMFGAFKNVAVTASQLERALDNRCMFDGSSIEGFVRIEESDMALHPDPDTFVIFPWRPQQGKVARMICDIHYPDGAQFEGDSRYILKKVIARAKEMGYTFDVGPECEFFLFDMDEEGRPTVKTSETAGYFDLGPADRSENTRRDMVLTMEDMGYVVEASHHEAAPAQHEIDLRYDEALRIADGIMTFKLAVKTIARQHGRHATFMPKPVHGVPGSGLHINMSLSKDGKNMFDDSTDVLGLSREAYYFIGGIMKHIKGITAIANPTVNSYKRLVSGYEAPVHIGWQGNNRSAMLRIPAVVGEHIRVELRSPDPTANPYLLLALCLAAGLEGIEKKIMPPSADNDKAQCRENPAQAESLPSSLMEAVICLEQDAFLCETLGSHISRKYIEAKKKEWEAYCTQITGWEIDQYLDRF